MTKGRTPAALAAVLLASAGSAWPAVVTRGPYLQTPTPTSIIVRWRTDLPTNSRVSYGAAPGSLGQNADDALPVLDHAVTLAGLAADTQYYYAVGSVGGALIGDDADHHFRTAPVPGTRIPLRLWAIGDAGFPGAELDSVRDAYATFNGTSAADLFLLLGDNAYGSGTDAQYQAAVFDAHDVMLRTSPVYSVVGNHEALSSNSVMQIGPYFDMFSFPTGGEAGGVASGTESYYSFDYANIHFIVLDSEQSPTSATTPMMTWLESDLQAATAEWIVAMWHRPPYTRGLLHNSDTENAEIRMRQYAVPILEDYNVDVVLGGHSHSYERSYLLDGHYGLSTTFSAVHQVDAGDGDPAGDGAYRKPQPIPHTGAVYVVNGSGSDVRNTTLNHPAMVTGLLELGSLVIDVDGPTLTARFLNSDVQVHDAFQIVKGSTCAPAPASGCTTGGRSKITVVSHDDDSKDSWRWKWTDGPVDAAEFGSPSGQTDLAVCVYDGRGVLVGGSIPHGATWKSTGTVLLYNDKALTHHGIQRIKVKLDPTTRGQIQVKAKGGSLDVPSLPAVFPITAQLVNLDSGACWESTFATPKTNGDVKVSASLP
jgi:hypothetical protein